MMLLLIACHVMAQSSSMPEGIDWQPSYAVAIANANAQNKLVMIDFYTDWDAYCAKMDQSTFQDPAVQKELKRFVDVKLNAEKEGVDFAKRYGVTGYPTMVFIDHEGTVLGQVVGYLFPAQFSSHIENVLDAHFNEDSYESRYKSNPKDALAAEKLAAIYAEKASLDQALAILGRALQLDPSNSKGSLARALNAVGDCYASESDKGAQAIAASYYLRATKAAKDPAELSYADERLAQAYMLSGKPDMALAPLNQALTIPSLGKDERDLIQKMIETAKGHS